MHRFIVTSALVGGLAAPAWSQSEPQPVKVTLDVARPDSGRGEQIEIFRRVLAGKLQRWQAHAFDAWCMQCHVQNTREGSGTSFHFLNSLPLNGASSAAPDGNFGLWVDFGKSAPAYVDPLSVPLVRTAHYAVGRPADLEGVYLKGHGVVYTVTLPPPLQRQPAPVAPAPLSDWDRARLELRGEQPKPAQPAKTPEPSLRETILHVLADNGKHFTGLQDNETITVAVTFRPELLAHPNDAVHQILLSPPRTTAERVHQLDAELNKLRAQGFGDKHPQVVQLLEQINSVKEPKSDKNKDAKGDAAALADTVVQKYYVEFARAKDDYEVLGDLMVRQGKAQEAIDAYKRALQANPPADRAAALHRKLAQAYLQKDPEKNAAHAQEALAEAVKLRDGADKPATPPKASAAKIPEKLVITVPLGTLKAVAAGKMSFEEFGKAARVEQVK